eukprot:jgi/Chrzof1/7568/Cz02g28210.t1
MCVASNSVGVASAASNSGPKYVMLVHPPPVSLQSLALERHKSVIADGAGPSTSYVDETDQKYVKRAHPLKRSLQRLFPALFAAGLPVSMKDITDGVDVTANGKGGKRRKAMKRSPYNTRNLISALAAMSCVATMLFLFIKVSSTPTP